MDRCSKEQQVKFEIFDFTREAYVGLEILHQAVHINAVH